MDTDKINKQFIKQNMKYLTLFAVVVLGAGGLYFYLKNAPSSTTIESMTSGSTRCPDILIQKGAKYFLYNSKIARVPGVNPIMFNNLEEYVEFLEWRKAAGIKCPVLYVQNTYDAQGERVYKIRPSAVELQGGLPPSKPINISQPPPIHSARDANGPPMDTSGLESNMLHNDESDDGIDNGNISANAMDANWGGIKYTEDLVESGAYAENEVYKGPA